jgi:hypothetical protein
MAVRQASAMPRTGAPPTIGETPTTVVSRSASAMPGTCRTVPMLTTGLLGGSTTTSAAPIASSTPGAGVACSAPTATTAEAGSPARWRTHHSWKWITRSPPSVRTRTWVSTRSSLIGSRRAPGCQRAHRASVTCDSG